MDDREITAGLPEVRAAPPETAPATLASAEQLWALDDQLYEELVVPEWGGLVVRVRGMTGRERDSWEASISRVDPRSGRMMQPNLDNTRAKMVARCVVDAEGRRVFSDQDVARLGEKSAAALDRIFDVARRLSRLTNEDVEQIAGNSSGEPSAANGSGSPATSASP